VLTGPKVLAIIDDIRLVSPDTRPEVSLVLIQLFESRASIVGIGTGFEAVEISLLSRRLLEIRIITEQ